MINNTLDNTKASRARLNCNYAFSFLFVANVAPFLTTQTNDNYLTAGTTIERGVQREICIFYTSVTTL